MRIKKEYIMHSCFLNELEWSNIIKNALRRINSTHVGELLLNEINNFISQGYNVTISNYSSLKTFQYPHFNRFSNTIFIPDSPYFIKVEILNEKLLEGIEDDFFKNIINCHPLDSKLDRDFCSSFGTFKFQPIVVTLFHELVHCLRNFYRLNTDSKLEEESTIYGIKDNTLIINGIVITENSLRKELGLGARISHNSEDLYVYNAGRNSSEYSKEYLKELFLKEDF